MNDALRTLCRLAPMTLAAALFTGCFGGVTTDVETEETLRTVEIPQDFDFSTTKALYVLVSTQDAGRLEVIDARGRTRYQGPALTERPTVVGLSVPLADASISLRLTNGTGVVRTAVTPIVEDVAEFAFD